MQDCGFSRENFYLQMPPGMFFLGIRGKCTLCEDNMRDRVMIYSILLQHCLKESDFTYSDNSSFQKLTTKKKTHLKKHRKDQ
jgi:hypothetical protein